MDLEHVQQKWPPASERGRTCDHQTERAPIGC